MKALPQLKRENIRFANDEKKATTTEAPLPPDETYYNHPSIESADKVRNKSQPEQSKEAPKSLQ